MNNELCKRILKKGGIGVIPTDTIYGLVGSALLPKVVKRIYSVKHRNPKKSSIVLIHDINDLKLFGIKLTGGIDVILKKIWPGMVSIVLPAARPEFNYLQRGNESIAFRLPKSRTLRALLKKTGPLIAPSANPEGLPPAKTIAEAKKYFGKNIDFYLDGGTMESKPSVLIAIKNGKIIVLRGTLSDKLSKLYYRP